MWILLFGFEALIINGACARWIIVERAQIPYRYPRPKNEKRGLILLSSPLRLPLLAAELRFRFWRKTGDTFAIVLDVDVIIIELPLVFNSVMPKGYLYSRFYKEEMGAYELEPLICWLIWWNHLWRIRRWLNVSYQTAVRCFGVEERETTGISAGRFMDSRLLCKSSSKLRRLLKSWRLLQTMFSGKDRQIGTRQCFEEENMNRHFAKNEKERYPLANMLARGMDTYNSFTLPTRWKLWLSKGFLAM